MLVHCHRRHHGKLPATSRLSLPLEVSGTAFKMPGFISNQEILQTNLQGYPKTLSDILHEDPERGGLMRLIKNAPVLPVGLRNSLELSHLAHSIRWHPALPDYGSGHPHA